MRNGVRENKSATIDLIWRENLISARTSLANKTNYAPMSVVRVYWGWALVEPLQTLYHTLRTLRQTLLTGDSLVLERDRFRGATPSCTETRSREARRSRPCAEKNRAARVSRAAREPMGTPFVPKC